MDLFHLYDDENYDKLCGHILFTTKGRLAYYCTLCGQYRSYESFIAHLLKECSPYIDDDLKVCITESSLTGSKYQSANQSPKKCSILQNKAVLKPTRLIDHKQKESIKLDALPILQQTNNSHIAETATNGKNKFNESFEEELMQIKYCDENFESYINVECLEEQEIDEQSHISYQVDEECQISYQLEQNNKLQTYEENQSTKQLEQINSTDELTKTSASTLDSNIETAKFVHNENDIPFVVRNVRARKIYLPSHIAPEDRKFKCPVCDFGFKDNHNMNLHLRRHTNMKSYNCPDCDKKFYTSTEVRLHSRVHKKPAKTFLCTECGLAFESNYRLLSHQKRHRNQKDYICEICKKGFYGFGQLKAHLSTHSTERPYSCQQCAASFKRIGGLRYHEKLNHRKFSSE